MFMRVILPLPQSQVSELDQSPQHRSQRVNRSPSSEREQSLPRAEMRNDAPAGAARAEWPSTARASVIRSRCAQVREK
jgi:hypothetical protein